MWIQITLGNFLLENIEILSEIAHLPPLFINHMCACEFYFSFQVCGLKTTHHLGTIQLNLNKITHTYELLSFTEPTWFGYFLGEKRGGESTEDSDLLYVH